MALNLQNRSSLHTLYLLLQSVAVVCIVCPDNYCILAQNSLLIVIHVLFASYCIVQFEEFYLCAAAAACCFYQSPTLALYKYVLPNAINANLFAILLPLAYLICFINGYFINYKNVIAIFENK